MSATVKLKKPSLINNTSNNGGAMSKDDVQNNKSQNIFPHVDESERTSGITRYRKVFLKKEDGVLTGAKFFIDRLSLAGDYFRLKEGTDSDVQSDAAVELECPASRGGLRISEHDANLHPDLIDEDDGAFRLGHDTCELPQGLRHEPGLESHMAVAHLALDLRPRDQSGNGVYHYHVNRVAAHQHLGYLQRLLSIRGLGDQEVIDVDPETL